MKIVFIINLLFYLITLSIPIYYQDAISGLYFQFWLGIFQIFLGLFYVAKAQNKDSTIKKDVKIYWLLVIGYFISLPLLSKLNINNSYFKISVLVVIPMLIGLYNLTINFKLQKS